MSIFPSTTPHSQYSKSCISEFQNSGNSTSTHLGIDCWMRAKKSSFSSSKRITIGKPDYKRLMKSEEMQSCLQFCLGLGMSLINGEGRKRISHSQKKLSVSQNRWRVGEKTPSRVIPEFGNAFIPKRGYGIQSLLFQKKDWKSVIVRDFLNSPRERLRQRLERQLQQWQRELEQHGQQQLRSSCSPALHLQLSP